MKKFISITSLFFIVFFTFAFAYMGCDDNNGKDKKKYTLLLLLLGNGGGQIYTGGGGQTYTVVYKGNGNTSGSVPIDSTGHPQGQPVQVLAISGGIVKNAGGYPFQGWNTAADGSGTEYTAGNTFLMGSANVTLYAQYFYAIGNIGPSGVGIVFDVTSDGLHGLEAAPALWNGGDDPTSAWITGGSTQTTANGHTLTGIGTGSANTDAIIAQPGETGSAAQICRNYTGGGMTDWFLPSYFELLDLHSQQAVVGGFANIGSFYWSSSENGSQAYFVDFLSGSAPSGPKDSTLRVRPIRVF